MEKQRGIRGLSVIALVVAVLGLTVAFAAMSRTLTIRGTATMDTASWDVHFAQLTAKSGFPTGAASVTSAPTIQTGSATQGTNGVASTHIGDYAVTLTKPGDYVAYTFNIVNDGSIDAKLGGYTMATPTFSGLASNQETAAADATLVQGNFVYTLTYSQNYTFYEGTANEWTATAGQAVATNDKLPHGQTVNVTLTIGYNSEATTLPSDDVSITGMNITMNYVQD